MTSQSQIPKHLAIIMDGNGRWAKGQGSSRSLGHEKGVDIIDNIVEHCVKVGVQQLTLFAFGDDNWLRPMPEIKLLMRLFVKAIRKKKGLFIENNLKFKLIGNRNKLQDSLINEAESLELCTQDHTGMLVSVAVSYSGRFDIAQAIQKIVLEHEGGNVSYIDEEYIHKHLQSYSAHYPDILIRTGCVNRISNFMLWDLAYTEIVFHPKMWPDFTIEDLDKVLETFTKTQRRFGKTSEQL